MHSFARRFLVVVVVLGALAFAGSALAEDYCVAPNTTCGGVNVATFQDALAQADDWSDTDYIYLGAATYTAPTTAGYSYTPAVSPVAIVGAGEGKTIITAPAGATNVLTVTGGGANMHDFTVRIPASVPDGHEGLVTDGWVENVAVTEVPGQTHQRHGVHLKGYGAFRYSTVDLAQDLTNNEGIWMADADTLVYHSRVTAHFAISTSYGGEIAASYLSGSGGVSAYRGTTNVKQTMIELAGWDPVGIGVNTQSGYDVTVRADGVVIYRGAQVYGTARGASAGNSLAPNQNVDLELTNSVIRGTDRALDAYGTAPGLVKVVATYSDFDASADKVTGPGASITLGHVTTFGGHAGFVDEAAHDFHLAPGSPLIDAGDPASAPGFFDLDGNPLDTDGDGDGVARRDVGAFEAPTAALKPAQQPDPAPVDLAPADQPADPGPSADPTPVAADTLAPVLGTLRRAKGRIRFGLSEAASVRIQIQRAVIVRGHKRWRTTSTLVRRGVKGKNAVRIPKVAAKRGAYRAVARATDAAGNRSAVRRLAFRVKL